MPIRRSEGERFGLCIQGEPNSTSHFLFLVLMIPFLSLLPPGVQLRRDVGYGQAD
jgi:hypothetical protein